MPSLCKRVVAIKSGGEMGSAIAWRLYQAQMRRIVILETPHPLAVRRTVSFCEAVHDGESKVEGVRGIRVDSPDQIEEVWAKGSLPVLVDPAWASLAAISPDVLVDAIIAKRNLGTRIIDAPLTIALGPGFEAGKDVHLVVETNRGHDRGRIITHGTATPNTSTPGSTQGPAGEWLLRAPAPGRLTWNCALGDLVEAGKILGDVDGAPIVAAISGLLRGQIRPSVQVPKNLKIGDIDPQGEPAFLHTISAKGLALGGAVLEGILRVYNK